MRLILILLFFLNVFVFFSKYKNPTPVVSYRDEKIINYEKCLVIRDYYKNRLKKLDEIKHLIGNKEYLEIEMLYRVSEYDLELAEIELYH